MAHWSLQWDKRTHGGLLWLCGFINCSFSHTGFLAQNHLFHFCASHILSDHFYLFKASVKALLIFNFHISLFLKTLFLFLIMCISMSMYSWVQLTLRPEEGIWSPTGFHPLPNLVLRPELLSSVLTLSVLNHCVISPALASNFLKDLSVASVISCCSSLEVILKVNSFVFISILSLHAWSFLQIVFFLAFRHFPIAFYI